MDQDNMGCCQLSLDQHKSNAQQTTDCICDTPSLHSEMDTTLPSMSDLNKINGEVLRVDRVSEIDESDCDSNDFNGTPRVSLDKADSNVQKTAKSIRKDSSNISEKDAEISFTTQYNENSYDDLYGDLGFTFDRSDFDSETFDDYGSDSSYISEDQEEEDMILEEKLVWKTEWSWSDSSNGNKSCRHGKTIRKTYDCNKIVRFSKTLVTEVHTIPKTTDSEFSLLFYSVHELQRIIDESSSTHE